MFDQMSKPSMTANMGHGSSSTVMIEFFESSTAGPERREAAGLYSLELELDDGETSKVFRARAVISSHTGASGMNASNFVQKASISVRRNRTVRVLTT